MIRSKTTGCVVVSDTNHHLSSIIKKISRDDKHNHHNKYIYSFTYHIWTSQQKKKYDTEQIKKNDRPFDQIFLRITNEQRRLTGKQVLTNIVCKGWSDTKNEISIIQKYNTTERWSGHPLPDRLPVKKEVLDTVSFPCERSILLLEYVGIQQRIVRV